MRTKRGKKHVEYRWFLATPETGLLGGIVASSRSAAESWKAGERYCSDYPDRQGAELIRVRMEYYK
jgi:hypothetical protein